MGILGLASTTVRKGQITETKILARLTELGYNCLIPWGNDLRYDIAIDNEGQLLRLQCKTGRYNEKKGIIEFNTAITYHARGETGSHVRRGYVGQADYFGIYCPELGTLYLVPVEDAPPGNCLSPCPSNKKWAGQRGSHGRNLWAISQLGEEEVMGKTQDAGLIGQTAVLNRLVQPGYEILLPWADYLGYDLAYLIDREETHFGFFKLRTVEVVRVQCKVAWLSKDGSYIAFNTHKLTNRLTKKVSYHGRHLAVTCLTYLVSAT